MKTLRRLHSVFIHNIKSLKNKGDTSYSSFMRNHSNNFIYSKYCYLK